MKIGLYQRRNKNGVSSLLPLPLPDHNAESGEGSNQPGTYFLNDDFEYVFLDHAKNFKSTVVLPSRRIGAQ